MANTKVAYWIIGLIAAAAVLNGLLAGGNVDRALIANPSWHQLGPVAWANFSRHADLGNGQFVYPIMAVGGTILSVAAAAMLLWTGHSPRMATLPILLAAGLMIAALPISFVAAPFMLSLRRINNEDIAPLGRAFTGFEFWGRLQGIFHFAAFCANIWSLAAFQTNATSVSSAAIQTTRCGNTRRAG